MKRGLAVIAVAALVLTGCLKKAEDQVPAEGLDAIGLAVEDQLNAPAVSILALLRDADERHQVIWPALTVGFDGKQIPVNWWLYRKGFIELVGAVQPGGGVAGGYVLGKKATDAIAANDPAWFEVEAGDPTRVDCTGPTAIAAGGCEVDLPITPGLTDAGRAAGAAVPAKFSVQAVVALNEGGEWQVTALALTGTQPIHNVALDAILGPEATRRANEAGAAGETESRMLVPLPEGGPIPLAPVESGPVIAPSTQSAPDYAGGRRVN